MITMQIKTGSTFLILNPVFVTNTDTIGTIWKKKNDVLIAVLKIVTILTLARFSGKGGQSLHQSTL